MNSASAAFYLPAIDLIGISPLWTGFRQPHFSPDSSPAKVQCYGRVLWLGIGCIRGTEKVVIDRAIRDVFQRYHLSLAAIAGVATLDIKADEQGLIAYCQEKGWPLKTFAAEELRYVNVPNPSAIVNKKGGTPSVAEAAALKMGETLLVSKQIEAKSVTVAVSLAAREYRG
ncbi:MAG: cobalamin biosynthesis protein [Microcystis sp. M04BS1]|jgi:cobalt-precorrin 5A hydrolase|uniref:Cobalamin biosynthesis protein n=1 Tax=Microcystis aeruginosa Ma_MB_S_20031200_S102 TaxID=2486254 RepID=A0A552F7Y8_MICAE|nr:cobalamin biosynthesis protein [Microcystis aeruginosa]MCA2552851.1 cobalamin biosynthesis protein [Microcystis sp. M04BS1]NCS24608.1 cobalamin biosynthesis protein [Microcystis aeruginosa BS13-02]TRU24118.1 MAG: cobalamin biosynthesis protein [Microcystis aeruginosa Ma_MB_S_20031200_S102D]TRU42835.1 MAG: cobalamin biosynthesis protein [Microcystis aeruginosa Ma_MB_S_20031200_S102]MDB9507667.1 cobalamin biosynthesis protein [Microcystis aeruginosa CS-338/01]